MSIQKRKLKSGKCVFDVTHDVTSNGKRTRTKKTFQTLEDAKREEARNQRTKASIRNKLGSLTLGEYIDLCYWPIASKRLEATTRETYSREIDKRIKPVLGQKRLDRLDRFAIQEMIDYSQTKSVARKSLGLLKTILNEAVGDGFIESNPATAKFAMPKDGKKRDNGLILANFADIGQFIEQVQKDGSEAVTRLVMSGLMLGLRPEERYALNHEDFDFAEQTVHVHSAYVTASSRFGGNQLKAPKTELSERVIPMPQAFVDWFYWDASGEGAWIVNASGDRLSPSTGRKMWMRYLKAHPELPQVTLENMRHSFATACLHAGMNVEDLSRMLGHSDINTTYRRYVKPDLANIREGLAKIPYDT